MNKKIFVVAVLVLAVFAIWFFSRKPDAPGNTVVSDNQGQESQSQQPTSGPVSINGTVVDQATADKRPIAVVVENHPDARPQSGLADADLVYETLAEGGITRFLAVYQANEAKNIGPVRSARTYFNELADELGALYAHVGGNSDALAYLKQGQYKNLNDLDQFFDDGTYFSRIKSRSAPHNVYTSTERLWKFFAARHLSDKASFSSLQYKDDDAGMDGAQAATDISIDFSLPQFMVNYQYDAENNTYLRFMAGKAHNDPDTGKQITAKTIVVQMVQTFPVQSDTPLAIGMTLVGSGKAYVFQDGKAVTGTWKKEAGDRTRFYNADGQEIKFDRGTMWVEIVPEDRPVTWK